MSWSHRCPSARLQRNIDTFVDGFKLPDKLRPEEVYTDKFLPPAAEGMPGL
ncbi:MAG: hypothetical protein JO128_09200 [Alphaproteobacteria bacterium]|nr:hypothetical protein [Alphaproteobacteria bacterium]